MYDEPAADSNRHGYHPVRAVQERAVHLMEAASEHIDLRRRLVVAKVMAGQGLFRARQAFWPVVTAAIGCSIAYAIAYWLLGHKYPLFAPIATWICLGFSFNRELRRVAEMAVGVGIGVGIGEAVHIWFGPGIWQILVVLIGGVSVARFVDRGVIFTSQVAVQGMVVLLMPVVPGSTGPSGRWLEALIGAGVGFLIAIALPGDVRNKPRELAAKGLQSIAETLEMVAKGIRDADDEALADALAYARGSQPLLNEWDATMKFIGPVVRVNPLLRTHARLLRRYTRASVLAERCMRVARVVARRALTAVEIEGPQPRVAEVIEKIGQQMHELSRCARTDTDPVEIRRELIELAATLTPERHPKIGWRMDTIVAVTRSLVSDTMQIAGISDIDAQAHLRGQAGGSGEATGPLGAADTGEIGSVAPQRYSDDDDPATARGVEEATRASRAAGNATGGSSPGGVSGGVSGGTVGGASGVAGAGE